MNLLNEKNSKSQFFSLKRIQTIKVYQTSKDEKKSRKQENISEKRAKAAVNKILKQQQKQQRAFAAAKRRRFNEKTKQTWAIQKQIQNKLKFAANKFKQLIVRLKLSSANSKQMNNNQMQTQKISDKTMIREKNKDEISIISRKRRMRASKHFDV